MSSHAVQMTGKRAVETAITNSVAGTFLEEHVGAMEQYGVMICCRDYPLSTRETKLPIEVLLNSAKIKKISAA